MILSEERKENSLLRGEGREQMRKGKEDFHLGRIRREGMSKGEEEGRRTSVGNTNKNII